MTGLATVGRKAVEQREALGNALVRLGEEYPNLMVLSPDVSLSTRANKFKAVFPNRFVGTGISEQNTLGMAAGLSTTGWLPVVVGYAMFVGGKAWEQVRNSIAYPHLNVKIVATHAGINVGADGVTHQAAEDIALMRPIPGMVILAPTDANQVGPVLRAALELQGPVYIRLERAAVPVLTEPDAPISIGGSLLIRPGVDATIVAIGSMVAMGLEAADRLASEGIHPRVISMVSIKPLDEAAIVQAAFETGAIVVAEDHSCYGGLGGAVAEALARLCPTPMEQVAVQDTFAESGPVDELRTKYHLTSQDIAQAVRKAIARRREAN
ncbi:MAG: transketolase C-terminal domain-containing protein [Anaerolineales bacterium]|jgi:transketolase